ncbi:MFS transporter [Microbacterium oleivorans]|uniref:MFS transporter n=1 Tax=Microbacterium oleivorans TaxID=273677 RepID=A0A7D5EW73_9MICO|nr:MFS transporter [Microbacterium oleivorans]QLD11851.1 MFS transporter [Microbacterium oleivorans]
MKPRAALWACLAAGFATLFDATVITYAAPDVAASLHASTAGVQWLLASFSLTFGLGLIPSGLLVAARFVQGLGAGVISAQVLGTIQDLFTGAARLRALGAYTATGALAGLLGPVAAALVSDAASPGGAWRIVLLMPLPFVLAALALGARGLPGPVREARPERRRVALDLPGIALLCAIVVAVTLPVVEPGLSGGAGIGIAAAAGVLSLALVGWERHYGRQGRLPLFAPDLVRSRGFVAGNVSALLWFGSGMAFASAVTLYFLQRPGLTPLAIDLLFAPGAVSRLVASLLSQHVFARIGTTTVSLGLTIQLLLFATFTVVTPLVGDSALLMIAAAAQIGLGFAGGLVEPPIRALTLAFASPRLHGVAASFLQLTQRLAATFLVALTTGILLTASGQATAGSLQTAVAVCFVASALSLAAALHPALRGPAVTPHRSALAP